MRVVVTGQVGLDKKPFLARVVELAAEAGLELAVCNVGQMMYAEAPDVAAGKILDLPLSRLQSLRRSVFKDILAASRNKPAVLVNTHATFRWRHGLFYAFDHDQMQAFDADLYVVLVDHIDRVHGRLARDGHLDHTLKDLMVWREEEILATELLSRIVRGHGCFYILALGPEPAPGGPDPAEPGNAEALARLLFQGDAQHPRPGDGHAGADLDLHHKLALGGIPGGVTETVAHNPHDAWHPPRRKKTTTVHHDCQHTDGALHALQVHPAAFTEADAGATAPRRLKPTAAQSHPPAGAGAGPCQHRRVVRLHGDNPPVDFTVAVKLAGRK